MSNAGGLHGFSNNRPLQTIIEAVNSDYEPAEPHNSLLLPHGDIRRPQAAQSGTEEWESTTSDSSVGLDEVRASRKTDAPIRSHVIRPRTR